MSEWRKLSESRPEVGEWVWLYFAPPDSGAVVSRKWEEGIWSHATHWQPAPAPEPPKPTVKHEMKIWVQIKYDRDKPYMIDWSLIGSSHHPTPAMLTWDS